jgi:tetratricopeptide (TPR) repeat protein
MQAQQLIDQGLAKERTGEFRQAIEIYNKVPEGMREYSQAQARIAMIQFRKLERLSAARATLENLGEDDDPFVNMTLGQIYYQLAKYPEARARIEAAIESSDTPVLPISDDDKDQMRYFLAWSWDKEYQLLGKDPKALEEAIKAWSYYFELANCSSSKTKRCNNAVSRKEVLAKALK